MKYIAKVLDKIEYSPNSWDGIKVGVFKVDNELETQIGEYERNYSTLYNTFHYFQKDGKDFALYSPHYTVSRIMELPSCKDIGGERPSAGGFCPVDYFVPSVKSKKVGQGLKDANLFGFVAGCIWGDDSSWKVQYLDLSEVEKGIIKREERFGYIELLEGKKLKDAIKISKYKDESGNYKAFVKIKTMQTFHLENGKLYDPFE